MDRNRALNTAGPWSATRRTLGCVVFGVFVFFCLLAKDWLAGVDSSGVALGGNAAVALLLAGGAWVGWRWLALREQAALDVAVRREEELEHLKRPLADGHWLVEALGDSWAIVYANAACERLWGLSAREMEGLGTLFGESSVDEETGAAWRRFQGGEGEASFEATYRLKRLDGTFTWVTTRAERAIRGAGFWIAGVTRDVGMVKELELARARSEGLYRSLFNLGQEAIARCDLEGTFKEANQAFCGLTGYAEAELRGMTFQSLTKRGWKTEEKRILKEQVVERGYSDVYEKECRRKDGSVVPVNVRMSVYQSADGAPAGMFAIIRDISREKAQLGELLAAKEAADMARASQNRFLSVVSHELRTPLNPVIGYADLLLSRTTEPVHRDFLHIIHDSASDMVQIIEDIMDFARFENGEAVIETSPFRLSELLDSLEAQSQRLARLNGNVFDRKYSWKNCAVRGDKNKIRKLLGNLISNACKFTRGGRVSLRCDLRAGAGETAVFRFEVEDTGVGIDHAMIDAIFKPFRSQDDVSGKGVGLGLAVVQRLVAAMEGRISVRSKLGAGTTFRVDLPLPVEAVEEDRAPIVDATDGGIVAGHRVLVVEDDEANLALAKDVLGRFGCMVTTALNGEESLEHLKRARFDLVLMDLSMPFMDGYEATTRLRGAAGLNRDVPVVAMTAFSARQAERDCLRSGMNDIVTKPVSIDEFEGLLRKWL